MLKKVENILMILGHSAGVGDLLRASASWRALKNAYPDAHLHLLFMTKDPGYVSERLISHHHLLSSFHTIDKRIRNLQDWKRMLREFSQVVERIKPDLIIDFEPHGLKSSVLCLYARIRWGIPTVGVDEFPLRGLFYQIRAPSSRKVLKTEDYTDRFFVVLKALGIERRGIPIELEETEEAVAFRKNLRKRLGIEESTPLIGLNIGCGTPDALWKRPPIPLLRKLMEKIQRAVEGHLLLTGASFEKDINEEFLKGYPLPATDMAGLTDILELPGLIRSCQLFVSTDSGPYHMSVALRVPTLAIFVKPFPSSYHHHPWVRIGVLQREEDIPQLLEKAMELLKFSQKEL